MEGGALESCLRSRLFLLNYHLFLMQMEGNGVLRNTNEQEPLPYSFLHILLSQPLTLHILTWKKRETQGNPVPFPFSPYILINKPKVESVG